MWFISPGKRPALKPADPEKLGQPPVENPRKIDPDNPKNPTLRSGCLAWASATYSFHFQQP